MPFVVIVDVRGRRGTDRVPAGLSAEEVLGGFERVGEEYQSVLADAAAVVDAVLELARPGAWSVGVGAGPVQAGSPGSTPAATGTALLCARRAVGEAQRRPVRVAVRGQVEAEAADAQAVLTALASLVRHRSEQAREAITLVRQGRTQAAAALSLGITRQAVGQRLAAAQWDLERELRPAAVRLLTRAAGLRA